MAKANDPPLAVAEIIDHLERMREEMLMLQRSLEKMEERATSDGARKFKDSVHIPKGTP